MSHASPGTPGAACLAIDVCQADVRGADIEGAEHDREVKPARTDGPWLEHGEPAIDADEGHVGMPAHDQGCTLGLGNACNVRTNLGAVDADVDQENPELHLVAPHDVDREH